MIIVKKCLWCESKDLKPFGRRKDGVGILECKNCQLVMVEEIPEDLEETYYNESYYNAEDSNVDTGYAEIYDLMPPAFLYWQNSLIEELNEAHDQQSFLEIGAATGNLLELLRENQPNLTLRGVEIAEYAVDAMRQKGFEADVAYMDKYKAKNKFDTIFSSETLEHLDQPKSFLQGVKNNLKGDGVFIFYVPSISLKDARREPNTYLRFNNNLEHLLHFTPDFFKNELPPFFEATALVKEFKTGFGPCIVGAVAKRPGKLKDLRKLFTALETEVIPAGSSDIFLKNLIIMALKFSQFGLADKAMQQLKKRKNFKPGQQYLLQGLRGYHSGELKASIAAFRAYLKLFPGSSFAIKSLLADEVELTRLYEKEIADLREQLTAHKSELDAVKGSAIIGKAIRAKRVLGRALKPVRNKSARRV